MKYAFSLALGLLILVTACKKDDQAPITPTPEPNKKLTSTTYEYPGADTSTITFEYDAQGRLVRTVEDDGTEVTFQYTGDQVQIVEWRTSENKEVLNFTGKLNSEGNLIEGTSVNNYTATEQRQHTYAYDADGYLTQAKVVTNTGKTYEYRYLYDSNHHLIQHDYYQNGNYEFSYLIEYNSGAPDRSGFSHQYGFVPYCTLFGKKGTEMNTKFTRKRPGSPDWFTTSTYVLDSEQYPVSQSVTNNEGETYTVRYKYE